MNVLAEMIKKADWFKSSVSEAMGECVEVAFISLVTVRHSKDPDGPVLVFRPSEWDAFLQGADLGEFGIQ